MGTTHEVLVTKSRRAGTERDNRELLAGCRAGDEESWSVLVAKYERLVFSIPLKFGLSREDAADVMQLTFSALIETIESVNNADSVGWWLVTVARRTTHRLIKDRKREVVSGDVLPDTYVEPSDEELARSLIVHDGLAQMGNSCRELLTALFADEEHSYVAVARRLGRPVGSIGPMRARCLGRLKDLLIEAELTHDA